MIQRRNTGPTKETRLLVWQRSGGACEWPGCPAMATDVHHRLNRKMGGRKGEMALRINGTAWLLAACRVHHRRVTSAFGPALSDARVSGWVLLEGEDGACVPVQTRHGYVLLDNLGGWHAA